MHPALRLLLCAALAAGLSTAAVAKDAGAPYSLDAKGKCHDSKGQFAKAQMCKAGKPGPCRDAQGRFAKCPAAAAKK